MADEPQAEAKAKPKVNPIAFVGAGIAIVAALFVIFLSNGKDKQPPPMELGPDTAAVQPSVVPNADPVVSTASAPDPQAVSSNAATRLAFKEDYLDFTADFPAAPANDPVIALLRHDADVYLAKVKPEARTTYDEARKLGRALDGGVNVVIKWDYTAKAGDLVSLFGSSYEFWGGAHGSTKFDTMIARVGGQKLAFADMLSLATSPSPAIVIAICENLKTIKQKKIGEAAILGEPIVCAGAKANIKADAARIALAPSNQPGKFGGVYAYYEPYEVGAYAEGSYTLTVQQAIFAEDLKPEFKPLFGGEAPIAKS